MDKRIEEAEGMIQLGAGMQIFYTKELAIEFGKDLNPMNYYLREINGIDVNGENVQRWFWQKHLPDETLSRILTLENEVKALREDITSLKNTALQPTK